jgi:molybdenum cofactor synthesis domain-containing protein
MKATVITVSNEVFAGADENRAGPLAVALLSEYAVVADLVAVPDEAGAIVEAVREAARTGSRVVMTCGGTGIGPTDVTVDAVSPLLAVLLPGIGEEIRRRGALHAPIALVSREVAGVIDAADNAGGARSAFVLAAPGSRGGVRDAVDVIGPILGHIIGQLDAAKD